MLPRQSTSQLMQSTRFVPNSSCYIKIVSALSGKKNRLNQKKERKRSVKQVLGAILEGLLEDFYQDTFNFDLARRRNFSLGKGVLNPFCRLCSCVLIQFETVYFCCFRSKASVCDSLAVVWLCKCVDALRVCSFILEFRFIKCICKS